MGLGGMLGSNVGSAVWCGVISAVLLWCVAWFAALVVRAEPESAIVHIGLRAEVELHTGRIHIGDVADVSGGPLHLRQRIAGLDIDELVGMERETYITQRQVAYRLQLAGVDMQSVRLEGAPFVRVKLAAIQPASASRNNAGRVSSSPLQAGNAVTGFRAGTANHLVGGVRPASLSARPAADSVATNQMRPNEHLSISDPVVLIKKGDLVRLMARVGPLEISTRGEALADGRLGQIIPVRNVDSKQTVHARVIKPATVKVEY